MAGHADTEPAVPETVDAAGLLGYETIGCGRVVVPLRQLVLKHGPLFLLTDAGGNITPAGACELGLFREDARFLSHYALTVADVRPDVLGSQAARRYFRPAVGDGEVVWAYEGRDGTRRRTAIRFSRRPDELGARGARWRLRFHPKDAVELGIEVVPIEGEREVRAPGASFRERRDGLRASYDRWRDATTKIESDDGVFNTAVRQAITDLNALRTPVGGRHVVTAGIPWYTAPFGRDSLITALQTLPVSPALSVETLRFLAAHQGRATDEWTEEEPGKILHELRRGEMAAAGEVPHVPYYGSVDATPLFVVLLAETFRWTGDARVLHDMLPHAERALDWIDDHGDRDGDGFIEYRRRSPSGLLNQGWKDSGDGVPFPDGTLPEPPIALVEVQGYAYAAKRAMADLYQHWATRRARRRCAAMPRRCAAASTTRSGWTTSASSRSRSTGTSARCRRSRRTAATCSGPAYRRRRRRVEWRTCC